MDRAVGPREPKAAGAGEAWAQAGSAAVDLAVVEAGLVVEAADSAAVDLAGGDDVGEILFAKHNEIQLWRKSDVVHCEQ